MPLTAIEIEKAKPPTEKKQYKLYDAKGLYLLIKSNGSKLWRFRYKFAKKHQEMALGSYPTITLANARKLADKNRAKLLHGTNPMAERKEAKRKADPTHTFEHIALTWWQKQSTGWKTDNSKKIKRWLTRDVFPDIGSLSMDQIDHGHITEIMLKLEKNERARSASNILYIINRIFGHALAHRLTRNNPAQGFPLSDILQPLKKVKHRAAITNPKQLGKLIYAIDTNQSGSYCTVQALRLIPRLFLRPKEVRELKWKYIDFKDKLLRIPDTEMKKERDHIVPLAKQVLTKLKEIQSITGYSPYVFPSQRHGAKPISKNVMTNALRRLGYSADDMSAHGFRSTASSILHEQGWDHDAIETQLAHQIGTETSRAYLIKSLLLQPAFWKQASANYLDEISSNMVN